MSLNNARFICTCDVELKSESILKIGDSDGQVLIDHESGEPFIPASSLAGALRGYLHEHDQKSMKLLFGTEDREQNTLFIEDAVLAESGDAKETRGKIERRPGLKINPKSGAAEEGHFFERSYLSKNQLFSLRLSIKADNEEHLDAAKDALFMSLNAMNKKVIRLGQDKSSGAGICSIQKIVSNTYNTYEPKDLFAYLKQSDSHPSDETATVASKAVKMDGIHFKLHASILEECPILVQGNSSYDHEDVDGAPMMNAFGELIIPGTSMKGVLRNHCRKILHAVHGSDQVIRTVFGSETSDKESNGMALTASKLMAEDSILTNTANINQHAYHRIRVDKFTGGVMDTALMQKRPVNGDVQIQIHLKTGLTNNDEEKAAQAGMILFALRDLALGLVSIGSGQSVGHGRLAGKELIVTMPDGEHILSFNQTKSHIPEPLNELAKAFYQWKEAGIHEA